MIDEKIELYFHYYYSSHMSKCRLSDAHGMAIVPIHIASGAKMTTTTTNVMLYTVHRSAYTILHTWNLYIADVFNVDNTVYSYILWITMTTTAHMRHATLLYIIYIYVCVYGMHVYVCMYFVFVWHNSQMGESHDCQCEWIENDGEREGETNDSKA